MELPGQEDPDPNWDSDKSYEANGYDFVWIKENVYLGSDDGQRVYTMSSMHPEPDGENNVSGLVFIYNPSTQIISYSSFWQADEVRGKILVKSTKEAEFAVKRIAAAYENIIGDRYCDCNITINTIEDLN